jgi:hypothetical protein
MTTSSSPGIFEMKEGSSRPGLFTVNERLDDLNLAFPVMERKRLGELKDRALSKPLVSTRKGDSSSIAAKGEGGSE